MTRALSFFFPMPRSVVGPGRSYVSPPPAAHAPSRHSGKLTSQALAGEEITDEYAPLLGETRWEDGRMKSPVFGSVGFLTPASELEIAFATVPEKEAYERWRNGYESGWAQAFDPIAIRILSKGDANLLRSQRDAAYGE